LNTAIAIVALVGLAWFGVWLAAGTLQSLTGLPNQVTTLTFRGFVANAFFLAAVGCAAYTVAATL
jgi:hypothetical protein